MKPFEILSVLPEWMNATPDQILDSPAFAMPCRFGDETAVLVLDAVHPADAIRLSILIEGEPHVLSLARSPRFRDLDAIWDSRADVPEPILLALVEKDAGQLLQLLENAVRRQIKLVGLAASDSPSDGQALFARVSDVVFSLTRSATVTAAFGNLRNLDLAHESIRSVSLPAVSEYAAFALPAAEISGLSAGDALLLPEMGTVAAKRVVDGRFVLDEDGVSRYDGGGLVHVLDAATKEITLGELFDATEGGASKGESPSGAIGLPLRLVQGGKTLANGRLDKLSGQFAFIVETTSP